MELKNTPKKDLSSLRALHSATVVELERYKLLVENIRDYAIFMLDSNGVIQTWNKGAEINKGYKPHEIIGKHFSVFYMQHDIDAKKPEKELKLAKKYGRVEDEDWRVRKDGSHFWANVVITALYDDAKQLVGFAKITRNLTDRKHQEDQLRKANTSLKQQQLELESLNTSKDEFISLASHQLRTPATSIKQYLGMIIEGFVNDNKQTQMDFIKRAFESNERQIDIVENLLKVAQIDAGKVVLRKIPIDLGVEIQSIIDDYADTFHKREQTVSLDFPKSPVLLPVDPTHFRMAIENLIDNASKYTRAEGKIRIEIKEEKGITKITIEDNGVGITKEDQEKLFKKFSRIPNELSNAVGGSGLGLYWVSRVIGLHGGDIDVESEAGKGTKFIITMPKSLPNA